MRQLSTSRFRVISSRILPTVHKLHQIEAKKMKLGQSGRQEIKFIYKLYNFLKLVLELRSVFYYSYQNYSIFQDFLFYTNINIVFQPSMLFECRLVIILEVQQTQMGCGAQSTTKQGLPQIVTPEALPRYLRKQLIGKGTYGQVYKCIDTVTNSIYAMKVIKITGSSRQLAIKQITQLKSQISMLKKLNHQYIVKYQSFDVTPNFDQVQIVMELVKQGTLKEYIDKNGPLNQNLSAEIGAKILQALLYLHQQSIIHRDLKCANILLTEDLIPKLSDFGTAKTIYKKDTDDIAKMSASLKGTPYYMAPEVIKRTGHNQSADIWSFGCLMIQMLSGKAPWVSLGAKFSQIINYISAGVHPPFPQNISRQCNFFLQSCLDPIPSKRLTAHELLKHRFIDKVSLNPLTNKKERIRKESEAKPKSRTTLANDNLQIEDLQNVQQASGQLTIRKQYPSNLQTPSQKRNPLQSEGRKDTKRQSSKPVKKHTEKYLNQISRLELLEAQMNEVSVSEQQIIPKDRYFIKKTLANLKSSKHGKQISKTSTTIKNSQDNIANLSASQAVDIQFRSNTQMSREQQAINTMIARAERNEYLQQQKLLQKQRDDEKRKWEQQLRQGAQLLKKDISSRYMITRI